MQDYTLSNYENGLWINELINLERWNKDDKLNKQFKVGCNDDMQIRPATHFSVFGTVVDIVQKSNTEFKLYTVDDGTGTIMCKQFLSGAINNLDALEDWNWTFNATYYNSSRSADVSSMCDTVFNDRTVQKEDAMAYDHARLKILESLRWSIVNSFRSSEGIEIGDSVYVDGKLYTYFNTNQMHVNTIRLITTQEELTLMQRKLEDTKCRLKKNSAKAVIPTTPETGIMAEYDISERTLGKSPDSSPLSSRRVSGLMTFDNVVEGQLAVVRSAPCVALPPSPKTEPGSLAALPVISEIAPPFDTYFVEEVSGSSSEDDVFIPPTPQVKRLKTD